MILINRDLTQYFTKDLQPSLQEMTSIFMDIIDRSEKRLYSYAITFSMFLHDANNFINLDLLTNAHRNLSKSAIPIQIA